MAVTDAEANVLPPAPSAPANTAHLIEHLRQSEERFRLLVESVKDYAIFMLSPEGKILSWNRGAERIKGYRAAEIIGRHFSVFYTLDDRLAGRPERGLRIATAEGRYEDEGWRVRRDGTCFFADVVITALFDTAGSLKGFAKVTRDITDRRKAEEAVRDLSSRLLRAHDEERRRLGRELHDSTAQTLTALAINVALLGQDPAVNASPHAARILHELSNLTDQASKEIRSISYLLHPPMLEQAGLRSALSWYVDGFAERTKIAVDLDIVPGVDRFPKDIETAFFRIAQESLTNVYRHSGSKTARVRLGLEAGTLTLEVTDAGKGFAENACSASDGPSPWIGVGISGMRERVRQLGGTLEVGPSGPDGTGVTVRAVVPRAALERPANVKPRAAAVAGLDHV